MAIYGMPRRRFKSNRPDIHIALICLCLVHPIVVRVSPQSVAAVLALHQAPAPWQSLGKIHRRMSWCLMGLWPAMFFSFGLPCLATYVMYRHVISCPYMSHAVHEFLNSRSSPKLERKEVQCSFANNMSEIVREWISPESATTMPIKIPL